MVVVLPDTNDMCIIRNPKTLKAKARFKTAMHKKCRKIKKTSVFIKKSQVASSPRQSPDHTKSKESSRKSARSPRYLSITEECNKLWQ